MDKTKKSFAFFFNQENCSTFSNIIPTTARGSNWQTTGRMSHEQAMPSGSAKTKTIVICHDTSCDAIECDTRALQSCQITHISLRHLQHCLMPKQNFFLLNTKNVTLYFLSYKQQCSYPKDSDFHCANPSTCTADKNRSRLQYIFSSTCPEV